MKISRILGILFFALLVFGAERNVYAQWRVLATLQTKSINVVYFLDNENSPLIGFAGGAGLSRTTDRGKTWAQVSGNGIVTDIIFKNASIGWFSTIDAVYKTADGGLTWILVYKSIGSYITGLFYNKTYGRLFLSNIYGNSMVSTDEGTTWNSFAPKGHNGFAFMDDDHGMCSTYNSNFLVTDDGGVTWSAVSETRESWQPIALPEVHKYLALCELTGDLIESNDGHAWNVINTHPQTIGTLRGTASKLYYRSKNDGFFLSTDIGATWTNICGPNGFADSRFYVHNDSIYAGYDNTIWFNSNPGGANSTISFSTNPFLTTKQCYPNTDTIQLKLQVGCIPIEIMSAYITNQPVFKINYGGFPFNLSSDVDTQLIDFIKYQPSNIGRDTAYLSIRFATSGADGFITTHDTTLMIIGVTLPYDSIAEVINPQKIEIDGGIICHNNLESVKIGSGCGSFSLISARLEDTSTMSLFLIDTLPRLVSENNDLTLHFRLTPKVKTSGDNSTKLLLTFERNSLISTDSVLIVYHGTFFDTNLFTAAVYTVPHSCKTLDSVLTLDNPLCDSIIVTSLSFQDSLGFIFDLPHTPFVIQPGKARSFPIALLSRIEGTFSNSIIVTLLYNGAADTTTIPLSFVVNKEVFGIETSGSPLLFGTVNPCKTKTKPFALINSFCNDITITKINLVSTSGDFTLLGAPTTPFILPAGTSDTLLVNFAPGATGMIIATLAISEMYNGISYNALISISGTSNSQSLFSFSSSHIDFDTVSTCNTSTKSAFLINDFCDSILISEFQPLTGIHFSKINLQLPVWLHAGDSLQVTYFFAPKTGGATTDSVTFLGKTPSGNIEYATLVLSGFGDLNTGMLSYYPRQFNFNSVSICAHDSASGYITNTGCAPMAFDPMQIFGDPDYTYSVLSTQHSALAPNDTIRYEVYLNPAAKGLRQGFLVLTSNNISDTIPFSVLVTGSTKILSASLQVADFGAMSLCDTRDTTFVLTNYGCDTIRISGIGQRGSGFGNENSFPIIIPPGNSDTIKVKTFLDTLGGKLFNSDTLDIQSDADNTIEPITLTKTYIYPHSVHLWLDGDQTPLSTESIWKVKVKSLANELSDVGTIDFSLDYDTDLLGYDQSKSSLISTDGKIFHLSGTQVQAGVDSSLGEITFNIYLAKDTTTSLVINNISLNADDPNFTNCVAYPLSSGTEFNYLNLCGDQSIRNFMIGKPISIMLHPNPAQDEIIVDVQSPLSQDATIEIFNALGTKLLSYKTYMSYKTYTTHLDTKNLPGGVYLLRVNSETGSAAQSFVKVK